MPSGIQRQIRGDTTHMTIRRALPALFICSIAAGAGNVEAGQPLVVNLDHSQVLTVARPPGTVIVGNPSIADVTISGDQVYLHARAYGTTNILMLDDSGNQLADLDVTVQTSSDNDVQVFKAGTSFTFVCAPDCETTLKIGDNPGYFDGVAKQQQKRNSIALGQKETESPTAPDGAAPPTN
jgi:Flp pilus assembly secretin CpaC